MNAPRAPVEVAPPAAIAAGNGRVAAPTTGSSLIPPPRHATRDVVNDAEAAVAAPAAPTARFAALESRNFRLLWFGLLTSNVGTWMATTAEAWLVSELEPGRSAVALGLIGASFAGPMLLLPPLGGALADRVPRLRLLRGAQIAYLALSVTLTILTLTDNLSLWLLMANAFLTGVVLAFDNPTRQALVPDLVARSALTSAVSLNGMVFTGAMLVGPALAGLLIPVIGAGGVFAVNSVSYLAVLWSLRQIRGVPERSGRGGTDGVLATMAAGFAYVRATPAVATLLTLSLLSGLLGRSYGPLLVVFARDVHGVGLGAFGVLVAAPGLGTLIGALGLASRAREIRRKGHWVLAATLASGGMLGAFAAAPGYAAALPLLLAAALCGTVASVLTATMLQLETPPALRGRVMGLYALTLIGVPALGTLLLGTAADRVGVRAAVGAAAALLGVATLLMARRPGLAAAAPGGRAGRAEVAG